MQEQEIFNINFIGNYVFVLKCRVRKGKYLALGMERLVLFSGSEQLPLINSSLAVAFVPWVCSRFPDTTEADESEQTVKAVGYSTHPCTNTARAWNITKHWQHL